MTVAHPAILLIAVVIALVVFPSLARSFFGNRDQFIEDVGLADRADHPKLIVDLLWLYWSFPRGGIWFNMLWFAISLAIVVAVTYHVLVVILGVFA